MPLAADVRAALAPVIPQDDHPYLSTTDGMAAITTVAGAQRASGPVTHLRTSEYVVATFADATGQKVLARAGDVRVARWHREELAIAAAWAAAGAPVAAPLLADVHRAGAATVSLWAYLPHDPEALPDAAPAGQALARMHAATTDPALTKALTGRPFRAPGKIARRLLALSGQAAFEGEGDTLVAAAATVSALTAHVPSDVTAIHGDYQPGNWLATADGVVAVDLATACHGPALWDLTLLEGRCGDGRPYPRTYWADFCAGYQVHPRVLDATACQRLRALATAVAALRSRPQDPARWAQLRATSTP